MTYKFEIKKKINSCIYYIFEQKKLGLKGLLYMLSYYFYYILNFYGIYSYLLVYLRCLNIIL